MAPADAAPDRLLLPSLPIVVLRLLATYGREDYRADDVVQVLETDPPLSGRLLRLANSAYYGFQRRVDTLPRAVVLLGEATVKAVALGASLLRRWRGRSLPPSVEAVWIHSYLCGLGCRHLAERLPRRTLPGEADALFLAGLLHDVGKIVFLAEDEEGYAAHLAEAPVGQDLRERELRRFQRDHAEAGAELLESWNLPPWLCALVRAHHGGELRAELQQALEVLRTAHAALGGEPRPESAMVTPALAADLGQRLARARPEAEAFFRAIS